MSSILGNVGGSLGGSIGGSLGGSAGASAALPGASLAHAAAMPSPHVAPGARDPDPVVALNFDVKLEDGAFHLGTFTSCEGLGAEYEVMPYEEGGQMGTVYQLPGRKKYTNIKLARALDSDSSKLATWFSSFQPNHRTTATIVALTPDRKPIGTWSLQGVFPVRWTGPQFKADGSTITTESIELAHTGFTFS
jgi:phage tail-like protein